MHQHFIHYLARRIVLRVPSEPDHPFFAEVQKLGAGFTRPVYHVSRRKTGPATMVAEGDTIWIVSQLFSPWGALPPALDARIDVGQVEKRRGGGRKFVAAKTSCWFPLADMTTVLKRLETRAANGKVSRLINNLDKPVGHSLQSMRLLRSGDPLEEWSSHIKQTPSNFISYRICDGTALAFRTVQRLLSKGEVVFWDRWCLPRRLEHFQR